MTLAISSVAISSDPSAICCRDCLGCWYWRSAPRTVEIHGPRIEKAFDLLHYSALANEFCYDEISLSHNIDELATSNETPRSQLVTRCYKSLQRQSPRFEPDSGTEMCKLFQDFSHSENAFVNHVDFGMTELFWNLEKFVIESST